MSFRTVGRKVFTLYNWFYMGKDCTSVSAASQQTLFIVSGSPSNLVLGGNPGVTIVLGLSAASQQTLFIVSGSPCNLILGEVTQMLCWGNNSTGG